MNDLELMRELNRMKDEIQALRTIQVRSTIIYTMNDDTAIILTPPLTTPIGIVLINARSTGYQQIFGMAQYRALTTVFCTSMFGGTAFAVSTGILGGTTGTDGKLTVSPHTDGKLYIENRFGSAVSIAVTFLGA